MQIGDDRQSSDDLWDETEALEVTSVYIAEKLLFFTLRELSARAVIPDDACIETMSDLTLNTVKGSCTDEENLLGIYLNHLLIWMLTTTLRGDVHDRSLEKLQKPLLDSFATDITSDRRVVTLTSDLIDLIDEDDPTLCGCDIIVGDLEEASEKALNILTYVTSLCQYRSINDSERYVKEASNGLCQKCLTRPCGAEHEDVALLDLYAIRLGTWLSEALVVVVYGDREIALGLILADDIAVKELFYLTWFGEILELLLSSFFGGLCFGSRELFEELVSSVDTLWTDIRVDPLKEASSLFFCPTAEAALFLLLLCHLLLCTGENTVNHPISLSFSGGHPIVAVAIALYRFEGLSRVLGEDGVEFLLDLEDLASCDLKVAGLPLHASEGLMDHHARVGKGKALPLGPCDE